MKRLFKWLIGIVVVLLVIVVILAGVGMWFARRSWPQVDGTVQVVGLSASAEVIRDSWGIPHIYAQNDHDLLFAQGYVHAQDRLWQMEANRHLCSGTLSEIVGESALDGDRYARTFGLRRVAEQTWTQLPEDSRALLQAYADGVNAYIEANRSRLPVEFTLLRVEPKPWTPVDSLAWGNMVALSMGLNHTVEIMRAQIIAEVGVEAAQELFPPLPANMPVIVPAEAGNYEWLQNAHLANLFALDKWLGNPRSVWGSNNWVIRGSRSASGMPMLANDTHLDLQMPSPWYENGLHGGDFDVVGFSFPGVPLIIIGHNQHIAWGITNLDPDVQDLYLEKLDDSENPTQYEFMGQWYDLETIPETIEVKDGEPVEFEVRLTRHGPLLNDVLELAGAEPVALRWALYDGSMLLESIVKLNMATNWDEFRAALQHWDGLSQNFVYADMDGNIGYQAAAKVPIRAPGHQGLLPVPGWTGEYEWQGFIPFDQLPFILNPPADSIATANNKVVSDDYPYVLTYDWWHPGYRAKQIAELLNANNSLTSQDMRDIQAQTYSLPAEILRPYFLAVEPQDDLQAQAIAMLKEWDLRYEVDRAGASIFELWYLFTAWNTIRDELLIGEDDEILADQYQFHVDKTTIMLTHLLAEPDNAWFDDVSTPEVETRDDILRRGLADAVNWLSERYGQDPAKWEWGRVHPMTFVHVPFGQSGVAPLEQLFNSKTVPAAGGAFTINMGRYSLRRPLEMIFGTSQRMIIDLADWDRMSAVNTTGQSEHLWHSNRQDQIEMWQNVEYHTLPFSREAVETNAEAVLTLTPQ